MRKNAIERLNDAIIEKDCRIVAGLDPTWEIIPKKYYGYNEDKAQDIEIDELIKESIFRKFCYDYIDVVKEFAPAIKINSAFFEAKNYNEMYLEIAAYAKHSGLIVIGDVKRADIGSTSKAYAEAYLGTNSPFDIITVNPYFGTDSVKTFFEVAAENDKALFILVKTSNKSSAEFQDLELNNGLKNYEVIADFVTAWGNDYKTDGYGYKPIGAVVGATHPEQAKELRERMPRAFFLVPGFGAQGATADDVAVNFDCNGLGAIVNSSRGLMCAYKKPEYKGAGEMHWQCATQSELCKNKIAINKAVEKYIF